MQPKMNANCIMAYFQDAGTDKILFSLQIPDYYQYNPKCGNDDGTNSGAHQERVVAVRLELRQPESKKNQYYGKCKLLVHANA